MGKHFLIPTISLVLLFLSPFTTANSPVLDTAGNPLEPGSSYYVLTSGWGAAGRGGLTAASMGPELCPLYVGQYRWWTEKGTAVTITPNNATEKEITVGSDVSIAFGPNYCRNSGVWQLSINSGLKFITNDGTPGQIRSTFKIEGSEGFYKIVYCFATPVPPIWPPPPPQPDYCEQLDATIPAQSNDLSWLSLVSIDNPLPFFGYTFLKVEDGSTSTK